MIDLEQQLSASLHAYADTMRPSAVPTYISTPQPAERLTAQVRWRLPVGIAAGLVVLLGAGLLWLARGTDRSALAPTPAVGTWAVPAEMPLAARQFPSVLWTGSEFIVWGGQQQNTGLADGAIYDPATGRWRAMAPNERVRAGGLATWAGDRMVVLSGTGGEAYDPTTDSWMTLPTLDGVTEANGFTDAVWAGDSLLGIGIHTDETGARSTVSVWKLDEPSGRWTPADTTTVPIVVRARFVSIPDQFAVHDLIATDDGFVIWDGARNGWRYSLAAGWENLPELAPYDGTVLITNAEVVWISGRLTAVANGMTATHSDTRVATLVDGGWSAWTPTTSAEVMGARPFAAGGKIVVLGVTVFPDHSPLVIDPDEGTARPMSGTPLETVIDQGIGWSGAQLLICGGQTPDSTAGERTTSDSLPTSNHCALWSP